jgi:hypothetical protein
VPVARTVTWKEAKEAGVRRQEEERKVEHTTRPSVSFRDFRFFMEFQLLCCICTSVSHQLWQRILTTGDFSNSL